MFDPLKKVTICDMVVQIILSKIRSGELKIGDRLPSERELGAELKVSRVSIREGIKILSSMGFLDVRVGDGTIVKKIDVKSAIEPLTNSLYLESFALIQLLETRKIIETALAGLAAIRATEQDIEALKRILDDMKNNYLNEDVFRESDANFHITLAEIAQNEILHRIIFTIRDLLKVTSEKTYKVQGAWDRALKYHEEIYLAIKDGNADKAEKVMLSHLDDVERSLLLVRDRFGLENET